MLDYVPYKSTTDTGVRRQLRWTCPRCVAELADLPLLGEVVWQWRRMMERVLDKLRHQLSVRPWSNGCSWTVNDLHWRPFNGRLNTQQYHQQQHTLLISLEVGDAHGCKVTMWRHCCLYDTLYIDSHTFSLPDSVLAAFGGSCAL